MLSKLITLVIVSYLVTGSALSQPGLCGDVNGNGQVQVDDMTALAGYLFESSPAPDSVHLGDVDGYPGLSMGDIDVYWIYLFTSGPRSVYCDTTRPLATSPDYIAYIRNEPVPADASQHVAEFWLAPTTEVLVATDGFTIPFSYSSSTSTVTLDSLVWATSGPQSGWFPYLLIDSAESKGLITYHAGGFTDPLGSKTRLTYAYFSIVPQPFEQTIEIDTTVWQEGSQLMVHLGDPSVIPTLFGTPTTPADPPSCCEGMTGDVNLDGNVNLSDLTDLVNFLFLTFDPVACPAEGNTYGDSECKMTLTDITLLIQRLFVTFGATDFCNQFDNFICGQFY